MNTLLEQPVTICLIGLATAAVVAFFWLQTRHQRLAQLLIAVVVATVVLVVIERVVVTDREHVSRTLHAIAELIQQNDDEQVLQWIHPAAEQTRKEAAQVLQKYSFDRAEIKRNLEVQVHSGEPQKATARFNAVVVLSGGNAGVRSGQPIPRFVTVELQQDGKQWRVLSYSHTKPMAGFQDESLREVLE